MRSNPRRRPSLPSRSTVAAVILGVILVVCLASAPSPARAQAYYYSGPTNDYGAFYGSPGSVTMTPTDIRQAEIRQQRRDRAQADREAREARRQQRDAESAERQSSAYQPPPAEEAGISLFGYQPASTEDIANEMIVANQRRARSAAGAPSAIPKPPPGMVPIGVGDKLYYYKGGEFFVVGADGTPAVVDAPIGAMVFDLPSNAKTRKIDGRTYYEYKGGVFTRTLMMGQVVYEVVPPPPGA